MVYEQNIRTSLPRPELVEDWHCRLSTSDPDQNLWRDVNVQEVLYGCCVSLHIQTAPTLLSSLCLTSKCVCVV